MAEDLKYIELKKLLGSPKLSDGDQFALLHQIAAFVNNPNTETEGRDLVLRALEKKK